MIRAKTRPLALSRLVSHRIQTDLIEVEAGKGSWEAAMPWNETYYPQSMRNLPLEVRLKAIEIANALLEEGYDEGKAIRIGIAKAKEWAERRGGL
jgi:hypothetical protein